MNLIKLGAAALNQTPLDWEGNKKNITDAIVEAFNDDVNVLCLPELCVTGYGCEDAFFMQSVLDKAWEITLEIELFIKNLTKEGWEKRRTFFIVSIGAPVARNGGIYNCSILTGHAGIQGIIPKKNLCSDGVHYESRWFKAWEGTSYEALEWHSDIGKRTAPFGCVLLDKGAARIGVEICEDAWAADRSGITLSQMGANIIINPSASHFAFGKDKVRKRFVEEGSRAFKCAYVYANLLGNESGRIIFDGDTYIASGGKIVSKGRRFSFKKYELTTAVVNLDKNSKYQTGSHKPSQTARVIRDNKITFGNFKKEGGNLHPLDKSSYGRKYYDLSTDKDCFTRAVALGLWDYMRKSHSKGFVLSLSGGADSAAVACLVRSMVICAYNELGSKLMLDKLEEMGIEIDTSSLSEEGFIRKIIEELLTCVYQGTKNSSDTTERAAFNLAASMGAKFHTIDVQPMVDSYRGVTEDMLGRELNWETDDIALQNIQARVRAPSVWMMANIKGALLLSTSNRSEAAVGYATMDGDTCGGLSPIAGVSKIFLLEWLWEYSSGDPEFGGLSGVLKLKPSAELRPQEDEQSDEDDLMPYSVLDKIEKMVVLDKMSPTDIVQVLEASNVENALTYVEKFFTLFTRNQWKRERYAPSFHLDDESLDPKTFFRFPILSAGFSQELKMLRQEKMRKAL